MQPSFSSLIRTLASVSVVLLIAAAPAAAQVRAPGNEKPLPESAQKAPPFQQGGGDGSAGPRMLAGTFVTNPTGAPEPNNGFSVACRPAGTGGSSFPVTTVVNSPIINGSGFLAENLFAGQFILIGDDAATPEIEGQFFQIQAVSDTAITLTQLYFGVEGSVSVKREMLLFTTCDVSFDSAFSAPPTIVISARGNQPAPGEQFLPAAIVAQIEQGPGPMTGEGFQMFLMSPGFPPHNPGGTGTVDFIAIGN